MKKIFELLIFCLLLSLALLVMSCGTRKTETTKTDNIIIENNYSQGSKIVLGNSFTYKPFDVLKPMVIDKKEYVNVIISNDKSVAIEKWKNRNINKTIIIEKTKNVHREDNTFLWLGIVLIIVFGVLAWFKIPSFKTDI